MALSYRQVKDLYDQLHDSGATTATLPDWSQQMNDLSGTDLYQAGHSDNFIKRASVGLDRLLESTGLPQAGEEFGRGIGSLVGNPEAGASIGEGAPRMVANFLPMLIPGGQIPTLARLGLTGLLSGGETYTQTGSAAHGLVSGLTNIAMPGVAGKAEQAVLVRVGGRLVSGPVADAATGAVSQVNRLFPTTLGQGLASQLGGQAAAAGFGEIGSMLGSAVDPNGHYDFSPSSAFLNLTLGQLPFAALHITKHGREAFGGKASHEAADTLQKAVDATTETIAMRQAKEAAAKRTGIESVPDAITPQPMTPEVQADINATLSRLRGEQAKITSDPNLTDEEKLAKLAPLVQQDSDVAQQHGEAKPDYVMGATPDVATDRIQVTGRELRNDPKSRTILVSPSEDNPPELRGKVVNYSKGLYEQQPQAKEGMTGFHTFGLPEGWHTVLPNRERVDIQVNSTQPNLELQATPASGELFPYGKALDEANVQFEAAKTPADLQAALNKLRAVQEAAGFPLTDDVKLKQRMDELSRVGVKSDKVAKAAALAILQENKRSLARLAQKEQQVAAITAGQEFRSEQETRAPYSEDIQDELNQLHGVENTLSSSRSSYADALVGGDLNRLYKNWVDGGRKGGFGGFATGVMEVAKTGKGLTKTVGPSEVLPTLDRVENKIDTLPVKQELMEHVSSFIDDPVGRAAFEMWPRKNEGFSFLNEKIIFTAMLDADALNNSERMKELLVEREGLDETEANDEAEHYLTRPHVAVWMNKLGNQMQANRQSLPSFIPAMEKAGGGFVWGLSHYDEGSNKLGKHTLPKSSELRVSQFKNMAGRDKSLADSEIAFLQLVVPEAFDKEGNVNVRQVYKGLKEKGPQVETHSYGMQTQASPDKLAYDRMTHEWYENLGGDKQQQLALVDNFDELGKQGWSKEDITKAKQYEALRRKSQEDRTDGPFATPYYRQISPFDTEKNPVNVIHVILPGKKVWTADGTHEQLDNSLGWAMYQLIPASLVRQHNPHLFEPGGSMYGVSDGEMVMFVGEQQSRWGQEVNKIKRGESIDFHIDTGEGAKRQGPEDHPLLPLQHQLVLKAVIAEAQRQGIRKVVLSDGETAMMTEGHDKAAAVTHSGWGVEDENGVLLTDVSPDRADAEEQLVELGRGLVVRKENIEYNEPSQSGGMRLHYDTTLPSTMKKLVGNEGEKVGLGVHKNAYDGPEIHQSFQIKEEAQDFAGQYGSVKESLRGGWIATKGPKGSATFRNSDGTPKSSVTGTAYDLTQAFSNLNANGGFTVADPSRAPAWVPQSPRDQEILTQLQPEKGGVGLWSMLARSENPAVRGLAEDLKKFSSSLKRIQVTLADDKGSGGVTTIDMARGAHITLNPTMFYGDQGRAEQVVAHELLHGLTKAELDNPTNEGKVAELDALRERLASQLPAKLKSNYQSAMDSGWIDRYDGSADMLKDLGDTWGEQNLVYGLLNTHELVSQGFTSSHMIDFMKSKKSEGGKSFYSRFTNWVGSLLGFKMGDSTAYDEFMSKTDAILQQGDWVSSISNYGERWFENQGVNPTFAKVQTQRAVSLVMDSVEGTSREQLLQTLDSSPTGVITPEMAKATQGYWRMERERGDDYANFSNAMDEQGLDPSKGGLDNLVQELANGNVSHDMLDILPDAAAKYVFAKATDMNQILGMVRDVSLEKNNGLTNLAQPQVLRAPVKEALKATERLLDAERMQEEMVQSIQGMYSIAPDGFYDKMVGEPSRVPAMLAYALEDGKNAVKSTGKWLKYMFQPTGQMARENPEAAEVISKGHQLQANGRKFASDALQPMGLDLNDPRGISSESVKNSVKEISNPRILSAINKYIHANQVDGKKTGGVTQLNVNHPEVQAIFAKLSQEEQAGVLDMVTKQQATTQVANAKALNYMQELAATRASIIVGQDNGLKTSQNVGLTADMFQSILDLNDPAKQQLASQRLQMAQSKFNDPQTFSDTLRYLERDAQNYNNWKDFYAKNPAYATAQRLGPWLVEFKRNGRNYFLQALTKSGARDLSTGGELVGKGIYKNEKSDGDSAPELGPDAVGLLTKTKELEDSQYQILANRGVPQKYLDMMKQTSRSAELATIAMYQSSIPNQIAPARGLTRGAEDLPYLENHITWVHKQANYWTRQLFRAQMDAHTLEKEIVDRPDLQQELRTHAENMLHPDSQLAQKVTRFASTWFMGYNVATAMINASQPFVTHVAEFTSMTGKPLDSYRRVLSALGEIAGDRTGGGLTPDHEWVNKQASQDGELDLSMYSDEAAAQESVATNYKRAIQLSKPQTLGQRLGTLAGNYSTVGMWLFKQGERINNEAALYASFDYYREQGLTKEDALAKAYEFSHSVNYGGGRAQRPVGAFSGRGAFPRSVAMLGTSLQSYVLGTTFQLARYLQKGAFRPNGLTPSEVYSARKAAVQMLGTQLAVAGVLGLPFVSGAIALLDKAFPGLALNKNLRGFVSSLFGEDEKNGNTLTDMAMTGIPSMMGWDMQSRLSMGNTVPGVSEVNGFQPQLLLGPPANLVSNFIGGFQKLSQADISGAAASLTPPALRKMLLAAQQASGSPVSDYKDRPLFSPTPGEILGQAIGFQPKRLSDQNAANRMLDQSTKNANRQESQFLQTQAGETLKGNFGSVRQALLARAQDDKTYDLVAAARGVARAASELQFPRDLRREGSLPLSQQRQTVLNSFGVTPGEVSETSRLQFQMQVAQRLGVPQNQLTNQSEIQQAQLMDQLKLKNPNLTRVELRQMAQKLMGRGSVQPTLQAPQEEQ